MTRDESKFLRPVWTPADTAEVLADWDRHTDQAVSIVADDRKPWWVSYSRPHKARTMNTAGILILAALAMAAVIVAAVIRWALTDTAEPMVRPVVVTAPTILTAVTE